MGCVTPAKEAAMKFHASGDLKVILILCKKTRE